ncbi:PREDICTED: structure-specific endonuclease subunit SLX4 [Ficedula albicollis]|uniref:structure-specific endonuclease subunit SLX4 n=1 Tax=Ficedula albicollis TaxID=59894 RepID=UPI0007AD82A0|nr:PREDICTED: structure-specific endonuclease subunit SLX4 [Ficedula albicollis]
MDEQDNDFKELWANILSRAKKNGDTEATKKVQSKPKSTTTRSKLRRGKAAAKSQTHHHLPVVKETNLPQDLSPKKQTLLHKEDGDAAACSGETAQGDGARSPLPASQLSTETTECSQRPLTVNPPSGCSQTTLPFLPAAPAGSCSSPSPKVRVAELVVERMQQFKRVAPEQLKHSWDGSVPKAAASGDFPARSQEQNPPEDDSHHLPSMEHDTALALALQQESKEEALASLEDAGLFFCQICQKDLTAMNTLRREQHVNRCLDEMEETQMSSSSKPVVPECPICGKQFQTLQSRVSHLKRCAVEMDVPPNLLLQAVQLQVATLGDAALQCPSNQPSRAKRKGPSNDDSRKTQKRAKMEPKDEDLQVAMAMSRSLLEQEKQEQAKSVTNVKAVAAFPIKWKPGSDKKRRRKGTSAPPPLLLQDPEKAQKRIQERVALMLTEEMEFPPTPQLPISRILEDESEKATWLMPLPKDKECFLWKISALTEPCDPESFYTAALTPPVVPWKPVQNKPENLQPSVGSHQPEISQQTQPDLSSQEPTCTKVGGQTSDEFKPGPEGDGQLLSPSQKDIQTLQDLVELAREGLTLTQWKLDTGHVQAAEQPGEELTDSDPPCSGFVPPSKEKSLLRSSSKRSSLQLLAQDFGAMVNNPHLSDVQFQVDSGDVLYAHLFVLYARCPAAAQAVHSEALLVEEDGAAPTQRLLLSDVSAEAVAAFLQYLYAADTNFPAGLRPQLQALAARFSMRELMVECENNTGESQVSSGVDLEDDLISVRGDEDCEDRAENFQDLLKSVWVGEDEEEVAMLSPECQKEDDSEVGEQELEEIYEFAATQRKMAQGEREVSEGTHCSICSDTEAIQGTNQQTEQEEGKRPESASVSNSLKDLRDGSGVERSKCDLSAQEENMQNINRCKSMNDPQTTIVPHHSEPQKWDGTSHGANEGGAVGGCEDVKDSRSSQVSHDKADHCEEQFPVFQGDTDINDSYERLFSASQGDHCEPSPVKEVTKESGKSPSEKHVGFNDSLLFSKSQKDCSPCKNGFCGSPTPQPYVSLFPALGCSPASPKSEGKFAREHVSTPKQNKKEKSFPSYEIYSQKAKELGAASRNEITVSAAELPHSELNKHTHVPVLSSPGRTQDAAAQGIKEGDVIVLSSDDEMELQQGKKLPVSDSALKKMEIPVHLKCADMKQGPEIPKPDPNLSDPETEQRSAQVSCGNTDTVCVSGDVKVSPVFPLSRQTGACTEIKQSPNPSPGKRLSNEMSPGTDSSWLVPGTPVLSKSRSSSTQTQVTSIDSLKGLGSKLSTKNLAAGNSNHEMTGNLIKVHETALSDKHLPTENSASGRSPPSSPATESFSKNPLPVSSVDPGFHSPGHTSTESKCANTSGLPTLVSPCQEQPLEDKISVSVVELEDSDREVSLPSLGSSVLLCEDPPLPVDDCWHLEYLSPARGDGQGSTASPGSWQEQGESPLQVPGIRGSTPLQGTPAGRRTTLHCPEKSPIEPCSSVGSRASYLDSKIWDDWNGEEKDDELPEILPLSQRLAAAAEAGQTDPVKSPEPSCQENNRSPSTPVTPMPAYSMMETPQLKKELSRFGVRALPKRQMVWKLKEIFQYTHRDGDSDFEDEIPYSQPLPRKSPARRPRRPKAGGAAGGTRASAPRAAGRRKQLAKASAVLPSDEADGIGCATAKDRTKVTHQPDGGKEQERPSVLLTADSEELPASQESAGSSLNGSDISFGSQSSFVNGFETCAFTSEEEEEEFPASQAAAREEEKLEAVRCYIRSNTALYNRILFYEPIELADLHAELKQNGIKISKAKLLDFLDSQCITTTMARARREQEQKRKESRKQRRRYRVKPTPAR